MKIPKYSRRLKDNYSNKANLITGNQLAITFSIILINCERIAFCCFSGDLMFLPFRLHQVTLLNMKPRSASISSTFIYLCIYTYVYIQQKLQDSQVSYLQNGNIKKKLIMDCLTLFLFLSFSPEFGSDIFKGLTKYISLQRYRFVVSKIQKK